MLLFIPALSRRERVGAPLHRQPASPGSEVPPAVDGTGSGVQVDFRPVHRRRRSRNFALATNILRQIRDLHSCRLCNSCYLLLMHFIVEQNYHRIALDGAPREKS